MATNISLSPQKAQEIMKRADSAMAKLNKIRGKTEEKVGEVFKMIETVGGAVAVAAARAKFGEVTVGPEIPAEALIGAGLSLAAFLDLPGKYSEHLHNIGNGVLSTWAAFEVVKLGGGVVLSKEEYENYARSMNAAAPAPSLPVAAAGEPEQTQTRAQPFALSGGQRRQTARETFAPSEVQSQEVENSR